MISEVFVYDLLSGRDDDDDPDEDKHNEGNKKQIKTRLVCNGFNIFDNEKFLNLRKIKM